jgi:hypothetical protein
MQFFFYSMGETRMGPYKFSSWTMHMASIIIFSTLWGVALGEWRDTSRRTRILVLSGLTVLVASTLIVGYGNFLSAAGPTATRAHCIGLRAVSEARSRLLLPDSPTTHRPPEFRVASCGSPALTWAPWQKQFGKGSLAIS